MLWFFVLINTAWLSNATEIGLIEINDSLSWFDDGFHRESHTKSFHSFYKHRICIEISVVLKGFVIIGQEASNQRYLTLLWLLVVGEILWKLDVEGATVIVYADDLAILAGGMFPVMLRKNLSSC